MPCVTVAELDPFGRDGVDVGCGNGAAGHAAQNMLLQAVALGLGAVPIGGFSAERIKTALGLPPDHEPVYIIPVGHNKN